MANHFEFLILGGCVICVIVTTMRWTLANFFLFFGACSLGLLTTINHNDMVAMLRFDFSVFGTGGCGSIKFKSNLFEFWVQISPRFPSQSTTYRRLICLVLLHTHTPSTALTCPRLVLGEVFCNLVKLPTSSQFCQSLFFLSMFLALSSSSCRQY